MQPFACPESTIGSLTYLYNGHNISRVLRHTCKVILLLPHTFHHFQSKICSWMLAQRPCQKQRTCTYPFKKQALASWRESFCCCLVFSKGLFPRPQGTTLLLNNKLQVFPSTTHALCGNLRGLIWESREGLHQALRGRFYFFFCLSHYEMSCLSSRPPYT